MDKFLHCRLIRKVKNLNIYVSLQFTKFEPVSDSRGVQVKGGTGVLGQFKKKCFINAD